MGINVQALVKDAFKQAGLSVNGALKTLTYHKFTTAGAYNPVTGNVSNVYTQYTITDAILTSFKFREIQVQNQSSANQIESSDQKLLIPYLSLQITAGLEDYVTISGEKWDIIRIFKDPTGVALHTFQIRRA